MVSLLSQAFFLNKNLRSLPSHECGEINLIFVPS